MVSGQKSHHLLVLLACLFLSISTLVCSQQFVGSTADLSSSWINQPTMFVNGPGTASHTFSPVLMRVDGTSTFYAGFYCVFECDTDDSTACIFCNEQRKRDCVFGVFIARGNDTYFDYYVQFPELVWSANRNNPVQVNAKLQLNPDGELILTNSDGTPVWSSETKGNYVAGMNLTEDGNLVLFGQNNETIWQSFDHPTDSLLVGQKLGRDQNLTASVSASNWSEGLVYLSVDFDGLGAYVKSDPPQRYNFFTSDYSYQYVVLTKEGLMFQNYINQSIQTFNNTISSPAFMKLLPDGNLTVFQPGENGWRVLVDLIEIKSGACGYPLVCSNYGFCSDGGMCSCLDIPSDQGNVFREMHFGQPKLGCSLVMPISCNHSQYQSLVELSDTYYFAFNPDEQETSVDECKNLCLGNCSCKAAVFGREASRNPGRPSLNGTCLLINEVFSIADNQNQMTSPYDTTMYVKVQGSYEEKVESPPREKASRLKVIILASVFAAIFVVFCGISSWLVLFKKQNKQQREMEEDFLDHLPGILPTRYSYENLKATTEDFSKKLGQGGFGSVYEGTLWDGTKIAVKCLDGLAQVRDSFLVEVKAIGRINHVNLVKLIGFCYEKSHRLLVYEYMANKSLDAWIFNETGENHCIPWQVRRNIISNIAKGLAYLHEECSPKIIHLDIKPQNILLDENFKAKISDFGLSKLIEKDQSKIVTTMRGTPGYLAPEWLSSAITEKADVYSFGIVLLEIICGRRNLDWSRIGGDKHLLAIFKRKAEEGKLDELVDKSGENMQENFEEAIEMMKIAAWCLQGDFTKRPSMSLIVKVLEGLVAAETNIEYDFLHPTIFTIMEAGDPSEEAAHDGNTTKLFPSELSGPR